MHSSQFDSNWELSSSRATHIARIFLDLKAMPPERMSAAGFAEFHPIASNDTADGRAKNRRVDLVILPRSNVNLAGPEFTRPTGAWHKITDDDQPAQKP
jgi:chemotaxis protein MotB